MPDVALSCIRTGPKVNTVEKLAELRRAGVNIGESIYVRRITRDSAQSISVRMNFSHGEYEYHQSVIDNTRKMVTGVFIIGVVRINVWILFP
jgi:pyruvate kinase